MNNKIIYIGLLYLILSLSGCRGTSKVMIPRTSTFFADVSAAIGANWLWTKIEKWTCPKNMLCESGTKKPMPGYEFKDRQKQQGEVVWSPGRFHSERAHVIASESEKTWKPEPGYVFYDKKNLYVTWSPGIPHSEKSHVVASEEEEKFEPAKNYVWSSKGGGSLRKNHQDLNVIKMGEVEILEIEHNVYDLFDQIGMRVHLRIKTNGLEGTDCKAVAFFSYESGEDLKDRNGRYRTEDDQVSFNKYFQPPYYGSRYNDFVMFIPYEEFDLLYGAYNLKFYVALYNSNTESYFANSKYESFRFNSR